MSRARPTAIAAGGELVPLVAALKLYEERRRDLEARLATILAPRPTFDPDAYDVSSKGISSTGAGSCARTSSRGSRYSGV